MGRGIRTVLTMTFLATALLGSPALAQEPEKASPPPATIAAPMVGEVKILCDDKAKNDGEINFVFTPAAGEAKQIRVTVQKKTGKQAVCKDIAKEIAVAIGSEYKVNQYDDDKVKVEGKDDQRFSLTLGNNTVTGLSIRLQTSD